MFPSASKRISGSAVIVIVSFGTDTAFSAVRSVSRTGTSRAVQVVRTMVCNNRCKKCNHTEFYHVKAVGCLYTWFRGFVYIWDEFKRHNRKVERCHICKCMNGEATR